jgi:hypothetical protein
MVVAPQYPDADERGRGKKSPAAGAFPMVKQQRLAEARTATDPRPAQIRLHRTRIPPKTLRVGERRTSRARQKRVLAMTPDEQSAKLINIFLPYSAGCRKRVVDGGVRFVHYTSAANALSIIRHRRLWMRNTTCMADYREVHHGLDALNWYFNNEPHRQAFFAALNDCHSGSAEDIWTLFNHWWQNTQLQTYITAISEHDDREDLHGRLSMWRAFGGAAAARVAFVIKLQLRWNENIALQLILHPVSYFTGQELKNELDAVVSNIQAERDFLRSLDRGVFITNVFHMLVVNVVCLKHEGFHEEREWRIIYAPRRSPSCLIESAIEVVSGVPQFVYKIPLENNPAAGISGIALGDILDRIIIGPSQFPWAMYEAFVAALDEAGVKDAANRVFASQIPVRT